MSNDERNPNDEYRKTPLQKNRKERTAHSGFGIRHSFVIGYFVIRHCPSVISLQSSAVILKSCLVVWPRFAGSAEFAFFIFFSHISCCVCPLYGFTVDIVSCGFLDRSGYHDPTRRRHRASAGFLLRSTLRFRMLNEPSRSPVRASLLAVASESIRMITVSKTKRASCFSSPAISRHSR